MQRRSFFRIALGAAVAFSAGLPAIASPAIAAAPVSTLTQAELERIYNLLVRDQHAFDAANYQGEWQWRTIDPAPRYEIVNGEYQRVTLPRPQISEGQDSGEPIKTP